MKITKKDEIKIADMETGESIPLSEATEMQVSLFLTNINKRKKDLTKLENNIKSYFKDSLEFGDENSIMFGNHKITRSYRNSFDKKTLEEKGTKKEKEWWDKLNRRYLKQSEVVTWR